VVGRATSVLSPRRAGAFLALGAMVVAYYAWCASLPDLPHWWDVGLLVFPIIPAVLLLVLLLLPLRMVNPWWLIGTATFFALVGVLCSFAGWSILTNFAKLFAPMFFGWWFLNLFERVSWVVLVACIIPIVDTYSVFWGPTGSLTKHHLNVYFKVAFAFAIPHGGGPASIGPPDVLFFALFLGAADRFGLRVRMSFLLMAVSFGVTVVVANALNVAGLPALPFLSAAFLLANADLLLQRRRAAEPG
jgi:hypothetical protein